MSMKISSYPIQKIHAKTVGQLSSQEYILQTSSLPEVLEYLLYVKNEINNIFYSCKVLEIDPEGKVMSLLSDNIFEMEEHLKWSIIG